MNTKGECRARLGMQGLLRLIAGRFMAECRREPGYLTDLGLEALVYLYEAHGDTAYLAFVDHVLEHRGAQPQDSLNWQILFTDLHSTAWSRTGNEAYIQGWLDDLYYYEKALPRDVDGRVLFFIDPSRQRLLIDMLQGYCIRLARAGRLTGDPAYFVRCAEQFELFARLLINPLTGLWHHGRGWVANAPRALSPDGWCRGQAWVLRGMVESLLCMPRESKSFADLQALLDPFATALFNWQAPSGMWHQMMQQPYHTFPETSGTGMIIYYLGEALRRDFLSRPSIRNWKVLKRAQAALVEFIDMEGHVYNGCAHGAPMATQQDYLAVQPVTDDPHAVAGAMMALAYDLSMPEAVPF